MSNHLRESKWLIVLTLAAVGFGLLVLTIGSIDKRMAFLHREQRGDSPNQRNTAQSTALGEPDETASRSEPDAQEEILESDSPEERIRKKFGMVKLAGVWLPATPLKKTAAGAGGATRDGLADHPTFAVPLYITTGKLPDGSAGKSYRTQIEAVGGVPPYAWSIESGASASPVTLDRASGELSGTPSAANTTTFRVRVTDAAGEADIAEYKLRVTEVIAALAPVESEQPEVAVSTSTTAQSSATISTESTPPTTETKTDASDPEKKATPLVISPTPLADANAGADYTAQFTASGGSPPYAWSSSGPLPEGLLLTPAGVLSGMPKTPGDYTLSVAVSDQSAQTTAQSFMLKVRLAVPDAVAEFTAFTSLRRVGLNWRMPADPAPALVRVLRNPSRPPADESDGLVLYEGLDSSFVDPSPPSVGAYYTAFALNSEGVASPPAHLAVSVKSNADPFIDSVVSWNPLNANAFGQTSLPGIVLGSPKGGGIGSGSLDVVSLGAASVDDPGGAPYGGIIVVSFDNNLAFDGPGADFTVFENVFYIRGATGYDPNTRLMEPAIVSVSQDGSTWFTFPCDFSPRYDAKTGALNLRHPFVYNKGFAGVNPVLANGSNVDPTEPAVSGGDSFDLADLHVPGLTWIRYVRIQATGDKWMVDADGELIRYPNTTTFSEAKRASITSGFDLDAVTAIWFDAVK